MISKTYYKYIWLLDTLLNSSPLTFEEINMLWEDCPASDGPIPPRTFHEHRKGIKEMFGGECLLRQESGGLGREQTSPMVTAELQHPSGLCDLQRDEGQNPFGGDSLGTTFLDKIIKAMQQNVELSVDYQRYESELGEEHLQTFHFQPYALKVFNKRWYLLGYLKERSGLRTIALNRILHLEVTTTSFTLPENFDACKHFANVVGIYVNKDLPVTKVNIRAYGIQADYLRSTPLHKSQSEGRSKHGEFAEFTYRLRVTPELESQLLAMGDKVEVLEPVELREEIKERISNLFNFYN